MPTQSLLQIWMKMVYNRCSGHGYRRISSALVAKSIWKWIGHIIDDSFAYTQRAKAAHFDGYGDLDLVAGAGDDHKIAWWWNEDGNTITWTIDLIQSAF
jgi:hypothetical protein